MLSKNAPDMLQLLDEKIRESGSRQGLFIEIRVYSYSNLLIDYSPALNESMERSGRTANASVRVWQEDNHCGQATGKLIGVSDLDALLHTAMHEARSAPVRARPVLVSVTTSPEGIDEDISGERARRQAVAFAHALARNEREKIQTLLVQQTDGVSIIANSAGLRVIERLREEKMLLRCETRAGAIVDGLTQPFLTGPWKSDLLRERMQAALFTTAEEGGRPENNLPVVLRPAAAAPLVAGLAWLLSGDTAIQTPTLAAALGHKIFPSILTVSDDPQHRLGTRRRSYDDEGQPSLPLTLIDKGHLQGFLHSSQSAARLASLPNGRGFADTQGASVTAQAINLSICPGDIRLPENYLEFTAKMETLKSMPRAGLVTMTVAGWEVRGGERLRRIGPLDLHLPLIPTFRRLVGVGHDLSFFPGSEGCGTPSLLFSSLLPGGTSDATI